MTGSPTVVCSAAKSAVEKEAKRRAKKKKLMAAGKTNSISSDCQLSLAL